MRFLCLVIALACRFFVASVSIHHRNLNQQTEDRRYVNSSLVQRAQFPDEAHVFYRLGSTESRASRESEDSSQSGTSRRHKLSDIYQARESGTSRRQSKSDEEGPNLHPEVFETAEHAREVAQELEFEEDDKYKHHANYIVSWGRAIERKLGFSINWVFAKMVVGVLLVLPSMPWWLAWEMEGNPPHPFILAEDAVPKWKQWMYDTAQVMALVGLDLILLGGVEWNWPVAMQIFAVFVMGRSIQGFIVFLIGVLREKSKFSDDSEDEDSAKANSETVVAENKFQDFSTSLVHVTILIFAQITFMTFYTYDMCKPTPLTPRAYMYWLFAIPMQIVARGLMGRSFCHECTFWHSMLHLKETDRVIMGEEDDKSDKEYIDLHWRDVIYRAILSFYCNNISMSLIAWSLPIFTMSAPTDIDFVKDCFAIVFITTLDDEDNVTITVEHHDKPSLARASTMPAALP